MRALANSIFFGLWTAFMVTFAVSTGAVIGDPEFFKRMQRYWALGLTRFWGVELEVHGVENMRKDMSYVVMANHASYADIVALFVALPVIPGFMAKRELLRIPFLGAALRAGGHVIVERGGQHDKAIKVIEQAARQVREGKTVLIFPEGTRSDSRTVGDFKSGGFRLARSAGVPIIPVGLRGTGDIGPKHSLLFWPGKVEVHIGEPMDPSDVQALEFPVLVRQVRGRIITLSGTPGREAAPA